MHRRRESGLRSGVPQLPQTDSVEGPHPVVRKGRLPIALAAPRRSGSLSGSTLVTLLFLPIRGDAHHSFSSVFRQARARRLAAVACLRLRTNLVLADGHSRLRNHRLPSHVTT